MDNYIPVMVERNGKTEIWQMDFSRLSVAQLIELREELLGLPYDNTIQILDAIIKRNVEIITPSCGLCDSYMKKYKKEKKNAKINKRVKMNKSRIRRERYDKY